MASAADFYAIGSPLAERFIPWTIILRVSA
jgi:hypothetical protein